MKLKSVLSNVKGINLKEQKINIELASISLSAILDKVYSAMYKADRILGRYEVKGQKIKDEMEITNDDMELDVLAMLLSDNQTNINNYQEEVEVYNTLIDFYNILGKLIHVERNTPKHKEILNYFVKTRKEVISISEQYPEAFERAEF